MTRLQAQSFDIADNYDDQSQQHYLVYSTVNKLLARRGPWCLMLITLNGRNQILDDNIHVDIMGGPPARSGYIYVD